MKWKKTELPQQFYKFIDSGYGRFTASALCKAGIETLDEAKMFLENEDIINPAKIRNIGKTTDVIWKHVYSGNKICVFGDYDADGITASAIMFLALKKLGANVSVRLPDRISEGYGISKKAIDEQIALGTKLFVTVDNGVRAVDETTHVKAEGCDIVILDHHEPGDVLPEPDAMIDLHIEGETYPFTELTGSGLAWKVAHYMLEQSGEHEFAMSLVDLAAIGTIGDVAPLHGENRSIVKRAIRLMRQPLYKRYGVKALMRDLSHVTAEDIAFRLAPCLNAPGRLSEHGASLALILLIEDDARIAYDLAQRVHMENESRKELQAFCYEAVKVEAEERIAKGDKVLVLLAKDAPSGIAGLLAGNLREEYGRPAIVFCPKEDIDGNILWTGSARSIEAFHMLEAIEGCKEYLIRYGGHKLAAGLTIDSDEKLLDEFRTAMNQIASDIPDEEFEATMYWDLELEQSELTDEIFTEMELLEPYGANAPKPIIKLRTELSDGESHIFLGSNNSHVKLFADGFTLIGFSLANKYIEESLPGVITAYGSVSYNSYRGNLTKQISLIDFDAA